MWARCCISWALGGKGRLWWMRYKVRHRKWTVGFWNEKSAGPTEKLDLWDRSGPFRLCRVWRALNVLRVWPEGTGERQPGTFLSRVTRLGMCLDTPLASWPDFCALTKNLEWRPDCGLQWAGVCCGLCTSVTIGSCFSSGRLGVTSPVFLHLLLHSVLWFMRPVAFLKIAVVVRILGVCS